MPSSSKLRKPMAEHDPPPSSRLPSSHVRKGLAVSRQRCQASPTAESWERGTAAARLAWAHPILRPARTFSRLQGPSLCPAWPDASLPTQRRSHLHFAKHRQRRRHLGRLVCRRPPAYFAGLAIPRRVGSRMRSRRCSRPVLPGHASKSIRHTKPRTLLCDELQNLEAFGKQSETAPTGSVAHRPGWRENWVFG